MFEKNKKELDNVLLANFSPFITQKAFSYYNDGADCDYINSTLNRFQNVFETPEDQFKFFDNIIPKLKRRKYNYLKKPKLEKIEKDTKPIPEFYCKRELDMFETLNK